MKNYKTVKNSATVELIERKSKFIGYCFPVLNESETIKQINEIRSRHYNATHNVYAYILKEEGIMRYSDDGEPQGTAGIPVLDVLKKNELTDTLMVVTRYFGGILLGAGGLVRAYSGCAAKAVKEANVVTMKQCFVCSLPCEYTDYGKTAALICECGAVIDDTKYGEHVIIEFHIDQTVFSEFKVKLNDLCRGKLCIEIKREEYFPFDEI